MKDKRLVIGAAIALALGTGAFFAFRGPAAPPASGMRYAYAADANAWLEIPEGALPDGVKASDIKITKVDASGVTGENAPLVVYDFQPDGLQFKKPVKLSIKTIAWDDGVPDLVLLGEKGAEPLGDSTASVDAMDRTVTVAGDISHFTKYGLAGGIFHVVAPRAGPVKVGEAFKVPFRVYYKTINIKDTTEIVGEKHEYRYHDVKTIEGDPKVSAVYQLDKEIVEPQRVTRPDNVAMADTEFSHEETFTCKEKGYFNVHLDVSFMYKYKWTESVTSDSDDPLMKAYDRHKDELMSEVKKVELVLYGECGEGEADLVRILVKDRGFYPLKQFHMAAPDACEAPHWHANARVYGVDRYSYKVVSMVDPAPKGCGFGTAAEVETAWQHMSKSVQDEMDKERKKNE